MRGFHAFASLKGAIRPNMPRFCRLHQNPRRYLRTFKLLPRLYGNARISSRLTGHLRSAPENGSLVQ